MSQHKITDDLNALLAVLPRRIQEALRTQNHSDELLEVVLDLGRLPEARFIEFEVVLSEEEVSAADLQDVVSRIGEFTEDNRAGIERTLHRISCLRNRQGHIIGMTCRVGRAVYGTIDIIEDIIIRSDKSILLLGRPGVGKTTLLRESARVLADKKRVVIVDTSNEIGGDGDIPHPSIGRARRMQVPTPSLQHEVMIEAVENHMPEVIIIDEIGREQEAVAARTIAERGVQLIGTAHGGTLENLLLNPTLSDLVGGIESVTLSDEEARRRGTQKSVLERRAPPTFDILVEIQDRQRLLIHHDVGAAVDALLRARALPAELRWRDPEGTVHVERMQTSATSSSLVRQSQWSSTSRGDGGGSDDNEMTVFGKPTPLSMPLTRPAENGGNLRTRRIYAYGVGQQRLRQAAQNLHVPVQIVEDLREADMVITLKNYYRKQPQPIAEAERRGIAVYVLRSNTVTQMETCLADVFGLPAQPVDTFAVAVDETSQAIQRVLGGAVSVDLTPQASFVRRQQHQMAREANLVSNSFGREPQRRVRIYRE
ncbi:MAG: R3H domain-containing nucleic acid-binding protein [Anaerolineae bacterium]|uniref:R3H domain-containing nucleic acid-binding protein n=1 Tax=Candidatus Amarolinea dominans TaxID=3140696 RepID=UPI001D8DE141|nr:AAA family ATPase [Anaerolineae bacterium]MBK7199927.1 AAA family ATPase [Anaerolineae bacterium]MBK9092367.1 AAA family ATPase [Anaerolineae bacterium]MBK9229339.1 AAA family ATPase [Anaerolineae bacterium]